jgi:protocatechuate 3,4-dioxygenase beta subunit
MTTFRPIRRKVLQIAGAISLASCASRAETANPRADGLPRTPVQPEGPFYPTSWDGDTDGNLTQIDQAAAYQADAKTEKSSKSKGALAPGAALVLRGTVLRGDGSPASNAQVDIWQTDHTGRYRHPDDAGAQPMKSGFQGYGRVETDAKGRYEFLTVRPADYASRPPHIHVRVDDGATTLITQMYFAGDNEEGSVFGSIFGSDKERAMLTVKPTLSAQGPAVATFDIYL